MTTTPATASGTQRWIAVAATVACALVAVTVNTRREDERTLRAANVAAADGRYDEARHLAAGLTDGTPAADAWFLRASVAVLEGRLSSAERAYRRALELRPNDWRAHRELAPVLFLQGDRRGAFVAFSRASVLNPKMPPLGNFGAP